MMQKTPNVSKENSVSPIASDFPVSFMNGFNDKFHYFSEASTIITASLDFEDTLRNLRSLIVPFLADWFILDLLQEGSYKRVLVHHKDPSKSKITERIAKEFPPRVSASDGIGKVIRTGESLFYPNVADNLSYRIARESQVLTKLYKELGITSFISAPLITRKNTLGALSFFRNQEKQPFEEDDFVLAKELAKLTAVSLENSLLYEQSQFAIKKNNETLALLDTLLTSAPVGFAFWDTQLRYIKINDTLARINNRPVQDHIGKHISEISDQHSKKVSPLVEEVLKTKQPKLDVELSRESENGNPAQHFLSSYYPVFDDQLNIIGVGGIVNEITERVQSEELIRHQALHDALTGLPNRTYFKTQLRQALAHAHRQNERIAVLFLDLDRFKFINDTLGHAAGDILLIEVANRLKSCLRRGDTIARLGGDEFMIMLTGIKSINDAIGVAKKIVASLKPKIKLESQSVHVQTSIGISIYPGDGEDPDMLLRNADTAMYKAKDVGGNNYQLYIPSMNTKAYEQLKIENSLREAITNNEFELYYQPQIDLQTGHIIGVETLVHWLHPQFGLIFPSEFIQVAEETGLILPIGKFVMYQACFQMKQWQEKGIAPSKIAINLSDKQLKDPKLSQNVKQILKETGLDPKYLEFELTENIITQNSEDAIKRVNELRSLGISFSIDDFGTGYSSLSFLKRFPVDTLKIDKSFIQNSLTDDEDLAIITAIISMAQRLNLNVIAEGVETQRQLELLKNLDCNAIQGYLFSMPVKAELCEVYLKEKKKLEVEAAV